jgi:hypothetical protein
MTGGVRRKLPGVISAVRRYLRRAVCSILTLLLQRQCLRSTLIPSLDI